MKAKKAISVVLVLTMLLSFMTVIHVNAETESIDKWDGTVGNSFGGGSGTEQDPYLISTGAQLAYLAQQVNSSLGESTAYTRKYFKMTNSIDLNNHPWTPIGYLSVGGQSTSCYFGGIFDGCGYEIRNLKVSGTYRGPAGDANVLNCGVGLFGVVQTDTGMIRNLGVASGIIAPQGGMAGSLVGILTGKAQVRNCYSGTTVVASFRNTNEQYSKVGGIVGQVRGVCKVSSCINYGVVTSYGSTGPWVNERAFGGIVGDVAWNSTPGTIRLTLEDCYFDGALYCFTNARSGALLGSQRNAGVTVKNCHVGGVVACNGTYSMVGRLIGFYQESGIYEYSGITLYTGDYVPGGVSYQNTALTYNTTLVGTGDAASEATLENAVTKKEESLTVPCAPYEKFLLATERGSRLYTVEKYDDISSYRATDGYTAPKKAGMVFAGWYEDSACVNAVGQTVTSGEAYAKFVCADVLSVKLQLLNGTTVESESTDLRMITTVDSLNYRQVGFRITYGTQTVEKISNQVYRNILSMNESYLPAVFSEVSAWFATYSLTEVPKASFGKSFTVVPVWVTCDGTTVTGAPAVFTVEQVISGLN